MKLLQQISVLAMLLLTFAACKPDPFKEIGDPVQQISNISGQWKLAKVTQFDQDAIRKGFPYRSLDITDVFNYADVTLNLSLSNGAPGSFTTENAAGLEIFDVLSGTWSVDNITAPGEAYLTDGNDTTTITLGSYPNGWSGNKLIVSKIKADATGEPAIRYDYEFTR